MRTAFIPSSNTSPILEPGKQILDDVSFFIEFFVVAMRYLPIPFRRNAWGNAFLTKSLSEPIGIVTTISQQFFSLR